MNKIITKIANQIREMKSQRIEPKFVVLDNETYHLLRSSKDARETMLLGHEQKEPYASDKIYGVPVTVITGNEFRVVEVTG